MNWKVLSASLLSWALLLATPVYAEDEEAAAPTNETRYIELTDSNAFITNYGGPGRIRYLQAQVTMQVESQDDFRSVMHHVPSIRHTIIMLLNKQTVEGVKDTESLKQTMMGELQALMEAEEGATMITDLFLETYTP